MKTFVSLILPTTVHRQLIAHLLPDGCDREQAAFVFAGARKTMDGVNFHFADRRMITEREFQVQYTDYLELADDTRAHIIKRAHDLQTSIVEFHSHPGPWPAKFSQADRKGLEDFVPHVWWRLKSRPYMAIVVAQSSFDGLVWLNDPIKPQPIDSIIAGKHRLEPTRLTLSAWETLHA